MSRPTCPRNPGFSTLPNSFPTKPATITEAQGGPRHPPRAHSASTSSPIRTPTGFQTRRPSLGQHGSTKSVLPASGPPFLRSLRAGPAHPARQLRPAEVRGALDQPPCQRRNPSAEQDPRTDQLCEKTHQRKRNAEVRFPQWLLVKRCSGRLRFPQVCAKRRQKHRLAICVFPVFLTLCR